MGAAAFLCLSLIFNHVTLIAYSKILHVGEKTTRGLSFLSADPTLGGAWRCLLGSPAGLFAWWSLRPNLPI